MRKIKWKKLGKDVAIYLTAPIWLSVFLILYPLVYLISAFLNEYTEEQPK